MLFRSHADLVILGFTGSYGRVAAFARDWRAERQQEGQTTGRGTFVPLVFRPGEAFQFDWSEDFAVLGGERTKLQVAHIKLSHSRAFLVRGYLLQTHEMLFEADWHGFGVLGGRRASVHAWASGSEMLDPASTWRACPGGKALNHRSVTALNAVGSASPHTRRRDMPPSGKASSRR